MSQSLGPASEILRVGAVSYLNTKPLVYGLDQLAPYARVEFDLPSRLADRLARGDLDVALIPCIEYLQNPEYSVVSDACIACRGPVLSVKVLGRCPLREIRTLALDEGSRTSVALARILLWEKLRVEPELVPFPIGADLAEVAADGILVIGDRAIHIPAGEFVEEWDLGDQWCRWSELPFVFAMWTARPGFALHGLEEALGAARDAGLARLPEIAERAAAGAGLSAVTALSYLRDNLHFVFGPRERQGLHLFYRHAARMGLAPDGWDPEKIGQYVT